jgi:hypothetical protein
MAASKPLLMLLLGHKDSCPYHPFLFAHNIKDKSPVWYDWKHSSRGSVKTKGQRQSTLDCRYLTGLIMWQFEKENVPPKLFFLTLFWEFVMFFQLSTHHSTILQPNNFIWDWLIRQSSVDCLWLKPLKPFYNWDDQALNCTQWVESQSQSFNFSIS